MTRAEAKVWVGLHRMKEDASGCIILNWAQTKQLARHMRKLRARHKREEVDGDTIHALIAEQDDGSQVNIHMQQLNAAYILVKLTVFGG